MSWRTEKTGLPGHYHSFGLYNSPFSENPMNINVALTPMISLLAGILILMVPRMLNYIVAIYLIVIGLVGLFGLR